MELSYLLTTHCKTPLTAQQAEGEKWATFEIVNGSALQENQRKI